MERDPEQSGRGAGGSTAPGGGSGAGMRPGCACGDRTAQTTADQQRAARLAETAAEIAAAEDFDPLRIRPYVTLGEDRAVPDPGPDDGAPGAAAVTMPLFLDIHAASPLPETEAPDATGRRTAAGYGPDDDPVQPRRRRPFAVIAVGAAVAAVVGTAAFAGGLFTGDDGRTEALPSATTSTEDSPGEPAAAVSESPSASPSASVSASPSASASASATATASPSKSATASRSASPTASATVTPSPSSASAPAPAPSTAAPPALNGSTLQPGDSGAEVSELQRRLKEVWLYHGPADGMYSGKVRDAVAVFQSYRAVQGDPQGVYGPNTRRALEAETTGRGRD
nr:peptidoglycan-binding domain-containing protein [Streptomyces finlayi]